uniref:Uncharacterized protein n=1 Tax=Salix viminalis TaxID=40686 RepID=A0A6N2KGH4_SALVM
MVQVLWGITGVGTCLVKMRVVEFWCTILVLFALLINGKAEVYIVTMVGEPVISYTGGIPGFEATAVESDEKLDATSQLVTSYAQHLEQKHDMLLDSLFDRETYRKLYSYKHLINGFAVHISPEQAETLRRNSAVKSVERDWKVRRLTTHTPQFLGLPTGVWPTGGGFDRAGEDIVIGFVDSGIFPRHPSFGSHNADPYGPLPKYRGKCEVDPDTKREFCNGKIIGAQHFAAAAIAAGAFNPSIDFASPMDGDGHGSHTAAIAAGNNGIPVRIHGHEFGKASGMAPRARIAVYKALYRLFGGFIADVVAAIDQAVHDGVDILSLSVGPNSPPATTTTTYLNPFDATLLGAVKAGVFVAQAAGNGGPFPKTLVSYSPWITSVAAAIDDRRYKNHLFLGNGKILPGIGLSPSTRPNQTYTLVAANDVLLDSSVMKYSPSDCQRPEVLNRNLVEGNILLCGYSFNFVVGTASIKKVSETAKSLGAIGFVLAVENVSPGTKFDPVPVGIPGILITDVTKSMDLIDYYNTSTARDWTGRVKSFKGTGSIGDGLAPILHKSAPQVALFSARGPNIKDFRFQDADLLKPDILAPGSLIWAAWSPNGTDEPNYVGEGFALISGTSMAAPHIAGIAALVKQKHPHWSPAAIKSALLTTSTNLDRAGRPIQAQQYSETEAMKLVTATPFDYGSGHVNPRAALDPGLIFDAGYEDYLGFLCTTPGIDAHEIHNYTNTPCNYTMGHPSNLNTPSITVSHLVKTQTVTRTVTNVAEEETYVITARMQPAVAIEANPPAMTLRPGASRKFTVSLTVRSVTKSYSFGEILMKGSRGHKLKGLFFSIHQMEEKSFLDRMLGHLRESCKYYTGYPKDLGPSRVVHFTSEREFVQLLHQGYPVVVAFTIRGNYTKHLDRVLEEAAAEFYPHVKFLRVECPKYPGFCITRQRKEYPFIEIFHNPEQAANLGRVADPNITKYSVKVLPVSEGNDNIQVVLTKPLSVDGDVTADYKLIVNVKLIGVYGQDRISQTSRQLPPLFNIPKSQLQCYGESAYCFSKNLLQQCNNAENSLDRFTSVVAWSISTTRPPSFGVAPYNPILGETHHVSRGSLNVLLEQVSHHPPVSALHATDEKENIELIWCQHPVPKFYGTRVEAEVLGKRQLKLLNHGETYMMNSPKLMIRFLPPRVDWIGKVKISCQETGFEAELCYITSSLLGRGGEHRVEGKIYQYSSMKTLYEVEGYWNSIVKAKDVNSGKETIIYDAKEVLSELKAPMVKDLQGIWPTESTAVWSEVSRGILGKNWTRAREAKSTVEDCQRKLAKERKSKGENWVPNHFTISDSKEEGWDCSPIQERVPPAPIVVPL